MSVVDKIKVAVLLMMVAIFSSLGAANYVEKRPWIRIWGCCHGVGPGVGIFLLLTDGNMRQRAASGWRFNCKSLFWHITPRGH